LALAYMKVALSKEVIMDCMTVDKEVYRSKNRKAVNKCRRGRPEKLRKLHQNADQWLCRSRKVIRRDGGTVLNLPRLVGARSESHDDLTDRVIRSIHDMRIKLGGGLEDKARDGLSIIEGTVRGDESLFAKY